MFKSLKSSLMGSLLLVSGTASAADLSDSIYNVEVSPEVLNAIQDSFFEKSVIDPAYLSPTADPNLTFVEQGDLSITFYSEGAGYKNTFGYFTYTQDATGNATILDTQVIFQNASAQGSGGDLLMGDTVDLGTFEAGTNVGFFVMANANVDTYADAYNTYYSIDSLNHDGIRHIAMVADPDNEMVYLGFEDLYGGGDRDYNDVVFSATATPYASIDTSRIPSGAPEAGQIMSFSIALLLLGVRVLGHRRWNRPTANGVAFA